MARAAVCAVKARPTITNDKIIKIGKRFFSPAGACLPGCREGRRTMLNVKLEKPLHVVFSLVIILLLAKFYLLSCNVVIANDGPRYVNQARQFLDGHFQAALARDNLFLYPLLIALFGRLGVDLVLAGELISVVSSVLVLFPLYLLFAKIGTEKAAMWSCLVFAVTPAFNKFSASVMRDSLFLLVAAGVVCLLWRSFEARSPWYFFLSAILSLVATTVRFEGVIFFPAILLLLFILLFKSGGERGRLVLCAGSFVTPLMLALLLGGLFLGNSSGKSSRLAQVETYLTKMTQGGLFSHEPLIDRGLTAAQAEIGPMPENDFIQIVRENVALIYLLGLVRLLVADMWWPFFLLACYGVLCRRERNFADAFLFTIIFVFLTVAYLHNVHANFLDERYLFVPAMLLSFWVGTGLVGLIGLVQPRLPKWGIFCILFALLAFPAVKSVRAMSPREALSAKEAGGWLASQPSLRGLSLIANGEKIPFYAGWGDDFIRAEFSRDFRLEIASRRPDLVTVETRLKNLDDVSTFDGYELLARFQDQKYGALIFINKNKMLEGVPR